MIRQIFHNILNNAVNACEPNIVKVSFMLSQSEKSLVLDIKDDGPGVPESLRETLFNAYVTSRSTGEKSKGMGLGLTICRQIAHDHGGQIELYSTGNQGTTFRLTLPLIQVVEKTQ
ncbi:MAG: ATP-binding protein [Proteobacteria bacterium]|nr:ATP-binding protein [Pseudomonadota bacterium]